MTKKRKLLTVYSSVLLGKLVIIHLVKKLTTKKILNNECAINLSLYMSNCARTTICHSLAQTRINISFLSTTESVRSSALSYTADIIGYTAMT